MSNGFEDVKETSIDYNNFKSIDFLRKHFQWPKNEGTQVPIIPFDKVKISISEPFIKDNQEALKNVKDALRIFERIKKRVNIEDKKNLLIKGLDYKYLTARHKLKSVYYAFPGNKASSDRVISCPYLEVWEQPGDDLRKARPRASVGMGDEVKKLASRREWAFIKVSGIGGFQGWVPKKVLEKPGLGEFRVGKELGQVSGEKVAVVTTEELETSLYCKASGTETLGKVGLGTKLRIINTKPSDSSTRLQVLLPGGKTVWVEKSDVDVRDISNPYPKQSLEKILRYSKAFLKKSTDYRDKAETDERIEQKHTFVWGGTHWRSTDSSGFFRTVLRMGGYELPRNTNAQYKHFKKYFKKHPELVQVLTKSDERKAGDLIFFIDGTNKCYHVAIASDKHNYIHSVGENPSKRKKLGVIESCLKDCGVEEHQGHDPYLAKRAAGYVVMRLSEPPEMTSKTNM